MAIESLVIGCPHCDRGLRVEWPATMAGRRAPRPNPVSRWVRRRAVLVYHHYDSWRLGKTVRDALLVHALTNCTGDPLGLDTAEDAE